MAQSKGSGGFAALTRRAATQSYDADDDPALRCEAHGCPNRWSGHFGMRLCAAHAATEPHEWPHVTHEQQHAQTTRAQMRGMRDSNEPAPVLSSRPHVLRHSLELVRQTQHALDPLAWARKLQHAHESGGVLPNGRLLTQAQIAAYRAALRLPA